MRLNAFLAKAGVASRRGADQLIKAGRVYVNGKKGQLNDDVSNKDDVKVNGRRVSTQQLRYVLLNKPAGYVTTLKDPENRPKVTDSVKINERVVPVGRLDFNTSGALLLTNDGQLAHQLMHPSFEIDKVYEAEIEGSVSSSQIQQLSDGVIIEVPHPNSQFLKKLRIGVGADRLRKISDNRIEIIIHQGYNRQVRRMLAAVGLKVKKLHRSQYGPLKLDGLKPGQWRDLTDQEVKALRS